MDKPARQRVIARSMWITVPGTLAVLGALYLVVPPLPAMEPVAERIALTLRWLFVANTLEQFVWLAVCLLALATLLQPVQMRLIPIACVFFAFARFVYWWGYLRSGTLGRAPGVQLTFTLNVALLVIVALAFARSLLR